MYFGDAKILENIRMEEIGLDTPTPRLLLYHLNLFMTMRSKSN